MMDLTTTPTTTTDTEPETPPPPQPPTTTTTTSTTPLSFTNGSLKHHRPHYPHHHRSHHPIVVTYKECLKNHAASLGGHAVDGCGEFMPSSSANPTDPTSLKCAACGCHRNFHRRDHHRHHSPPPSPPALPLQPSEPHILFSLSTAAGDEINRPATPMAKKMTKTTETMKNPHGKKRFRTKFSKEQKEKMFSFSEKLGWKLQKSDEVLVENFCNEVGVGRGVFKVWMHNNKNTLGKIRDFHDNLNNNNNNINGDDDHNDDDDDDDDDDGHNKQHDNNNNGVTRIGFEANGNNNKSNHNGISNSNHHYQENTGGGPDLHHLGTNGPSSSS